MNQFEAAKSERVLILAPTSADAALCTSVLGQAGMSTKTCSDLEALEHALADGAGAILLTEEILAVPDASRLAAILGRQPPWSDIPTLLLSTTGVDSPNANIRMASLGNLTVLERPVRLTTLVSALQTAVRARRRQYELRDQMAALRKSEERFHIVARTVHESIWDLDVASGTLWSSEVARPLFGTARDGPPTFASWTSRRHPEDGERVAQSFEDTLASDQCTWTAEYRYLKDGTYLHVLDRGHILRNGSGRAIRVVGAMVDLTERKRGEEVRALHASIVESSEDAIVSKTLDGIILSWNGGAERLYGFSADEAIGNPITIIIPPGRESEEVGILERLRQGQRVEHFDTVRRHKDGTELVISLTLSPVRDSSGLIIGASTVARDITARRQAENTMRKQSQRLRLLLEAASILLTSEESDIMMRAVFRQIGGHLELDAYAHWRTDEGRPVRLESSFGIPEESLERIAALTLEAQEPGRKILGPLGLSTFVRIPLVANGRLRGILLFASRRAAPFDPDDQEFLRTICHYVTAAGERVRLIRRLQDTDRRKDEFLATLAHELRNPLAPVRNSLEIMRLAADDPAVMARAREMMERQMGQMVRLIDDLLDVSRITRGRLQLKSEPVRLESVIKLALETARPLIDDSGHRLIVEGAEAQVDLLADPVRLAQVLSNLLNNAAKYTEPGGIIRLTVALEDSFVSVTIADTGVGIAPEALPGVFDMFNQLPRTLERSQGGLGIGLTLVKRLVEMHGGTVEANSAGPGEGSAFTVRLPVAPLGPGSVHPERRPEKVESASASGRRILIADDNRDAAESMALILRMMGNEVCTVHDGKEAVEEASTFDPEVVLLDIGMPLLNGYDAARRIRASSRGEELLLVALTGWGQEDDKRMAAEAGFDLHFTKPLEPTDLQRIVQTRREERELP